MHVMIIKLIFFFKKLSFNFLMSQEYSFFKKSFSRTLLNTSNCNYSGQCLGCGKTIESIHLSPEEYEFLKRKILSDVIDGGDQYKKTTPQVSLDQVLLHSWCLEQGMAFFSLKGQIVNTFSCVGHTVPFATFLLCCCSENSHRQYINE